MNIYTGTWNIVFHVPIYFFRGPVVEQNRRYSFPVVQAGILIIWNRAFILSDAIWDCTEAIQEAGGSMQTMTRPENAPTGAYYHPKMYMQSVVKMFEQIRRDFGWDPGRLL